MTAHLWLVATTPAPIYVSAPTMAKAQAAFNTLTAPPAPATALSPPAPRDGYVSAADICRTLRIGRSTLYRWIGEGSFPKPFAVGPRAVRWLTSDLCVKRQTSFKK